MTRRSAIAVSGLLLLVLGSSCSERPLGDDQDPKVALIEAAERTLGAESFLLETHIVWEGQEYSGTGGYVAPDRFFLQVFGPGGANRVTIGKEDYISEPNSRKRYTLFESPCDFSIEVMLPAVSDVKDATDVRRDGDIYTFKIRGEGTGEAHVEGDYLTLLRLERPHPLMGDQRVDERYVFSDFGESLTISPPPGEQVVRESDDHPGVVVVGEGSPSPCPS